MGEGLSWSEAVREMVFWELCEGDVGSRLDGSSQFSVKINVRAQGRY